MGADAARFVGACERVLGGSSFSVKEGTRQSTGGVQFVESMELVGSFVEIVDVDMFAWLLSIPDAKSTLRRFDGERECS